ncbi:organic cation/carnitine transporter 2-like [Ostrea edulis]|uniref:organic cation/carnitine transporter 2-like n=1 Tax=Ostrea edulis TaxID=37623 RepID=UPI0024AF7792|nr:organic cation/carnitine transporter 2-like [Ostrea edulis]
MDNLEISVTKSNGSEKKLDEDYIYGKWGPYQIVQTAIVLFNIWPTGFQLLIGVFIGYKPEFQCAAPDLDSEIVTNSSVYVKYEKCHIEVFLNNTRDTNHQLLQRTACLHGFQYSLDKDSTIVTEMDLVCDHGNLPELVQTLVMAGQLVGAAFGSSLSDKVGRKTVLLGSHLLTLVFGIGVAFSPNYTTLGILKFILGVLQQGMVMSNAVMGLELFPQSTRFYMESLGLFFWTTGLVIMAPIAYLLRHYSWRYLQIALTCFSLFSLVQYWVQDESLRWLLANGKTEESERIIRKVAKWNKINYADLKKIVDRRMARDQKDTQQADTEENKEHGQVSSDMLVVEKYSILTVLRSKTIFIISLIMWFTWVTNTVTYFGLTLTSTSLAGDRFLNFFLSAVVEYIAAILEYIMLRCLGRRTITIVFHAICGVSLTSATLFKHFSDGDSNLETASVVATFVGKMAITGSFSTLFLYTPELYPTNLRNVGIGFSSSFSRIGAIVSPFAGTLAEEIPWAPGTIFSAMCFIVVVILLYLPETRGVELPQTLTEVKLWYTDHSGLHRRHKSETTKL